MAMHRTPYQFRGTAYRKSADVNAWTKQRQEPALEPELPILDPHQGAWDDARGRYLIHELAEDGDTGHNILATVFIEATSMYRADGPEEMKPVGEVEFANGLAAMSASGAYGKTRQFAGIVGYADLTLGERVEPVLEAMTAAGNGRFRGIRHGVVWDTGDAWKYNRRKVPRYLMLDPMFRKGFARLQALGHSFEAWIFHPQLSDLADLMRAFPESKVVLDHVGGLLGIAPHDGDRDEVFKTWRASIRELARFSNLH